MTTTPFMLTVPMSARIASTAAPSPPFLSPRPTHRPAAMAAASVTRTSSSARLRSGAGRSARKPRPTVLVGRGLSGPGNDTGPPRSTTSPGHGAAAVAGLCCDPRVMTDGGPTSSQVHEPEDAGPPATPPAVARAARFNAANMLRSLLPLVVLCLLIVAWTSWRQSGDERVQTVDPSSTVQLAAARASYPVLVPTGLPDDYLVTSARTDAGKAEEGDTVTLELGYLTPTEEFAGFVVSDDPGAGPVVDVLQGEPRGSVEIGGQTWQR